MIDADTERRINKLEEKVILLEKRLKELEAAFANYVENNKLALRAASTHIPIGGR